MTEAAQIRHLSSVDTEPTSPSTAPRPYEEATALFREGRLLEAREKLARFVQQRPEHVGAHFGLAVCADRLGDLQAAEAAYRATLLLDPAHVNANLGLAALLQRTGQQEQASLFLQAAQRLAPERVAEPAAYAGSAPPAPAPASTPEQGTTLADDLDSGDDVASAAGAVLYEGHRALLAHRRLWGGLLLLLVLPALGLSTRRIAAATPMELQQGPLAGALGGFAAVVYYLQFAVIAASFALLVSAVLDTVCTRYVVRERRIDVQRGVLFRSRRPVWLYDVNDVEYSQSPVQLLARTATLTLHVDEQDEKRRAVALRDLGSAQFLRALSEELQPKILRERRAMKKQFV